MTLDLLFYTLLMVDTRAIAKLEKIIDYKFHDVSLIETALTHRSWTNEMNDNEGVDISALPQNERLEFVGDSVLGMVIAEMLYKKYPNRPEGDLTLMKHQLVSTETLAEVGRRIGLGKFLRLGRGEEKTHGREKPALLANALEAVIAAVFFDSGYVKVRRMLLALFVPEIEHIDPNVSIDFKTTLQEQLQAIKQHAPSYQVIATDGPPHRRIFTVEAEWFSGKSVGKGKSIKSAEMAAAKEALKKLK